MVNEKDRKPLRIVWLSWLDHQRTRGIAAAFGHEVMVWEYGRTGLARYISVGWRTALWLARERPDAVIVQCPSIILALLALVLRPILGFSVIVDAHNEIVQNFNFPNSRFMAFAYRVVLQKANFVIVTNSSLANQVRVKGGRPTILPDAIVSRGAFTRHTHSVPFKVAVISTFAPDEPIDEIVGAARKLGAAYRFSMTGKLGDRAREVEASKPDSLVLTGFLSDDDYWRLLEDSDLIIDLTLKSSCLVCGAYEALSIPRPLVLSDDAESRRWFGDAAVYTANSTADIVDAVQTLASRYSEFSARQAQAISDIQSRWNSLAAALVQELDRSVTRSARG